MKRYLAFAGFSLAGGWLAHIGVFYFLRIEDPFVRHFPEDPVRVSYVGNLGLGSAPPLQEQSILYDSTPLFMPTRWNLVSDVDNVASLGDATRVFDLYPPDLHLPQFKPDFLPARSGLPSALEVGLRDDSALLLGRYGRIPIELPMAPQRAPSIVAYRIDRAEPYQETVHSMPESVARLAPEVLWPPIQLNLQIVEGKPVGFPLMARGSGFTEWDQALQAYVRSLAFYRTLRSGYYRITVFP